MRKDWVGETLGIFEDQGCPMDMIFKVLSVKNNEVKEIGSHVLPHTKFDGMGGIMYILRYYDVEIVGLPFSPRYGWRPKLTLKDIFNTYFSWFKMVSKKTVWKNYNSNLESIHAGDEISYYVFNQEETAKIYHDNKSNTNGLFLQPLDTIIKKQVLQQEDAMLSWFITANMRKFMEKWDTGNYLGGFFIQSQPGMTIPVFNAYILEEIKKQGHWFIWWLFNIPQYIGKSFSRFLFKFIFRQKIGIFSNMGSIKFSCPFSVVVGSPPANKMFPFSAVAGNMNGHLILTLRIHPVLMKTREEVDLYCREWAEQIRQYVQQKA